jgi:hypothetical protein
MSYTNWKWEEVSPIPNGTSYTWNASDTYGAPSTTTPYTPTINIPSGLTNNIANGFNKVGKPPEEGFWSQLLTGLQKNITQNPVGFGSDVLGGAFNIWQALDVRQHYKQALALDREKYELQKQIALNNEQRNQEQWDMLKKQRASSAL